MARAIAVLLCCTLGHAEDLERIRVETRSRQDWVAIPGKHIAAVAIERAYDPATGKVFDASHDERGDPRRLVRYFRLEKKTFLLGEPILIEHRVEMKGDGSWREHSGGNYRSFGRDDNYLFLMRHAVRGWVQDPYEPWKASTGIGGGLSFDSDVTAGEPYACWLALQRYAALTKPGTYRLYCIRFAGWSPTVGRRKALAAAIPPELAKTHRLADSGNRLVRIADGKPSAYTLDPVQSPDETASPVVQLMGKEHAVALRAAGVAVEQISDFAHFVIEVRRPSAEESLQMTKRMFRTAKGGSRDAATKREQALGEAVWFARQPGLLPLIALWMEKPSAIPPQDFDGLAMRTSPAALKKLLQANTAETIQALRYLPAVRIPDAIWPLTERLTDPDDRVRSAAFSHLTTWTGHRFDAGWRGYRHNRPTLEEGRVLQKRWREWWMEHKDGFKPVKR